MSAWIRSYSLADISDQTLIVAKIECDTDGDLPDYDYFAGYELQKGSEAHVIDGNTMYMMDSSGTWIRQDEAGRFDAYTKQETDSLIQQQRSYTDNFLDRLFNITKKNLLNVWGQTSQVINGITWTINSDGSVRASGTASADSILYIWRNAFPPPTINEDIMVTGMPEGSSASTWNIGYTTTATGTMTLTQPTQIKASIAATTTRFFMKVVSGQQNVDLLFQPMVIPYGVYEISPDFAPYAPTNVELYQLIRSYHP